MENKYLEEVMQQTDEVERKLKKRAAAPQLAMAQAVMPVMNVQQELPGEAFVGGFAGGRREDHGPEVPAVDVRITGWWKYKTVVVPPAAYVVHTRRGFKDPITIGQGLSFGFNPYTDSFLVVPAAMQTIVINARCISKERQGILVQAYVQWIIDNFAIAYRKLDFSDPFDPMKVVNVQLREQAEATIKDTVATMEIDQILSDKQPIITELTRRLREVAEGQKGEEGLGLRIVTIQIKEAIVSSTKLWETLQRAFRAERAKDARLAELKSNSIVLEREKEEDEKRARLEISKNESIAKARQEAEAEEFNRTQNENARRAQIEAELKAKSIEFERETTEKTFELERLRQKLSSEVAKMRADADDELEKMQIELERLRKTIENDISDASLQDRLIALLPEIYSRIPQPTEVKQIQIGDLSAFGTILKGIEEIVRGVREKRVE
ncbi:MAG: SPFH domain-containing protein [Planctomycetes bacterium]|nr:SPFH domain-containing protein [Planctomycetota bacterium]